MPTFRLISFRKCSFLAINIPFYTKHLFSHSSIHIFTSADPHSDFAPNLFLPAIPHLSNAYYFYWALLLGSIVYSIQCKTEYYSVSTTWLAQFPLITAIRMPNIINFRISMDGVIPKCALHFWFQLFSPCILLSKSLEISSISIWNQSRYNSFVRQFGKFIQVEIIWYSFWSLNISWNYLYFFHTFDGDM